MTNRRLPRIPLLVGACAALVALSACAPVPPTFTVATPTPNPTSTAANRTRVVTVGDSLMSGYGLDVGQSWPTLLAARTHVALTNLACGGMGFVVVGDCGTAYSGLVPAVAALQPDIVIVQASSNDFDEDAETLRTATLSTIQELQQAAPGALIVGLSTIWNDEEETPDEVAITSKDLEEALTSVGGAFLDVGQPLAGHPSWMQEDDIHPTVRGQEAIEEKVRSRLAGAGVLR